MICVSRSGSTVSARTRYIMDETNGGATKWGATLRVILLTGKGGVGKTTLAAATAVAAARRGVRTLLVSTDAAHSVGDVLDRPLGAEPAAVAPGLDAVQLDGRHELQRSWSASLSCLRLRACWKGSAGK